MLDDLFLVQPESSAGSEQSRKRLKKGSDAAMVDAEPSRDAPAAGSKNVGSINDLSAFMFKRQDPLTKIAPAVKAGPPAAKASGGPASGADAEQAVRGTQPAKAKLAGQPRAEKKATPQAPTAKNTPAAKKAPAATKSPAAAAGPAAVPKLTPQTLVQQTSKPAVKTTLQPDTVSSDGPPVRHEDAQHFFGGRRRSVLLSFAYTPAIKQLAAETIAPCLHARWSGEYAGATPSPLVTASPTEPASARVADPPPNQPDTQENSGDSSPGDEPAPAPKKSANGRAGKPRSQQKRREQVQSSTKAESSDEAEALIDRLHPLRDGQAEGARQSRRGRATVNYSEVANGGSEDDSEVRAASAVVHQPRWYLISSNTPRCPSRCTLAPPPRCTYTCAPLALYFSDPLTLCLRSAHAAPAMCVTAGEGRRLQASCREGQECAEEGDCLWVRGGGGGGGGHGVAGRKRERRDCFVRGIGLGLIMPAYV